MSSPTVPFLALITPVAMPPGGGGGGGNPPGFWGGGGVPMPTPPIANVPGVPGTNPPGFWGGSSEGFPTHPIAPGGPPPHPAHPIVPIVWPEPPEGAKPPGGGVTGSPEHPIEVPPEALNGTGFWKQAFAPNAGGWVWVWVPYPPPA